MADRTHFEKKLQTIKLVGVISYEPLVGSHANFMWCFSGYFRKNSLITRCQTGDFETNSQVFFLFWQFECFHAENNHI